VKNGLPAAGMNKGMAYQLLIGEKGLPSADLLPAAGMYKGMAYKLLIGEKVYHLLI
jgi:hypothetical protein